MLTDKFASEITEILNRYPAERRRSAVMPLLYLAQSVYGHLSKEAIDEVGALTGVAPTDVAGVVGFYSLYHDHAAGKRRVQICTDLPCALRGADAWAAEFLTRLNLKKWDETTADGEFTVEHVMCIGACDKAPCFQVQDSTGIHFHESAPDRAMTVDEAVGILEGLKGK
ncbi:MAG: NAD(P)H-dependent oxidoreductase subunit E [Anaerolineales bacterium]|nr:NAD(P)H-dependent oxidoreductase subunit E [Anaerolineales bacterium]